MSRPVVQRAHLQKNAFVAERMDLRALTEARVQLEYPTSISSPTARSTSVTRVPSTTDMLQGDGTTHVWFARDSERGGAVDGGRVLHRWGK